MLPLIVLRRFDLVLAENKQAVLDEKKTPEAKGITGPALERALSRIAATDRKQELFNTSGFTFEKLLGDAPNIAGNLLAYIQGFSPAPATFLKNLNLKRKSPSWTKPTVYS